MAITNLLKPLFFITAAFLPLMCMGFAEENPNDQRLLVLLDDLSLKYSHSIFFTSLASNVLIYFPFLSSPHTLRFLWVTLQMQMSILS